MTRRLSAMIIMISHVTGESKACPCLPGPRPGSESLRLSVAGRDHRVMIAALAAAVLPPSQWQPGGRARQHR